MDTQVVKRKLREHYYSITSIALTKMFKKHQLLWENLQNTSFTQICDALRDLVPFVQFKKREKHPWRSVTFRKVAG